MKDLPMFSMKNVYMSDPPLEFDTVHNLPAGCKPGHNLCWRSRFLRLLEPGPRQSPLRHILAKGLVPPPGVFRRRGALGSCRGMSRSASSCEIRSKISTWSGLTRTDDLYGLELAVADLGCGAR